jgi:type VI secretion system protein ImpH
MGAQDRLAAGSLVARLAREPYRFEFDQAVRLLEQFADRGWLDAFYRRVGDRRVSERPDRRVSERPDRHVSERPDRRAREGSDRRVSERPDRRVSERAGIAQSASAAFPIGQWAVGEARNPQHEVVSFRPTCDLAFPASDLVKWELPESGASGPDRPGPVHLVVAFMGLAGSSGPLPHVFTELIQQRVAAGDPTMRDFLEIFNHRLISLLHRARKKHRIALDSRLPEDRSGGLARLLRDAMGLPEAPAARRADKAPRARRHRDPWQPPLRYAGLLAGHTRSMAGLEAMLADYFKVPVRGTQLLGRWIRIEERDTTVLSASAGRNHRLGIDTVVGGRLWDQMGRIELSIGPLTLERLRDFLPSGSAFVALNELIRFYLQHDLEVDIVLSLDKGQRADTRLKHYSQERLGQTSWMRDRLSRPKDDPVRLRLPALGDIRKFDDRNERFELRVERAWLHSRLLIGLHGGSAEDLTQWLEHSFIGADSEIFSLREKGLLGATRTRIDPTERMGLRVLPGSTLFEIAHDEKLRHFVHPDRPLVIHNPHTDAAQRRPSEILLYLGA